MDTEKERYRTSYCRALKLCKELGDKLSIDARSLDKDAPVYNPKNYFVQQVNRYIFTCVMVDKYVAGLGKILEVGVVPGHMMHILSEIGYGVYGIDIDPERLDSTLADKIKVRRCDVESEGIPFDDNSFDAVLVCEVLEHLRINPLVMLREIRRVLKRRGVLILTTPNRTRLISRIRMIVGNSDIESPYSVFKRVEEYGHAGHIRLYSFSEIHEMISKEGFSDIEVTYFNFKTRLFANKDQYGIFRKLTYYEMIRRIIGFMRPRSLFNLWIGMMHAVCPSLRDRVAIISVKR